MLISSFRQRFNRFSVFQETSASASSVRNRPHPRFPPSVKPLSPRRPHSLLTTRHVVYPPLPQRMKTRSFRGSAGAGDGSGRSRRRGGAPPRKRIPGHTAITRSSNSSSSSSNNTSSSSSSRNGESSSRVGTAGGGKRRDAGRRHGRRSGGGVGGCDGVLAGGVRGRPRTRSGREGEPLHRLEFCST